MADDVTRNYHGGNRLSTAAHESIRGNKARDRTRIIEQAQKAGRMGLTCDEAEQFLHMPHQSCSARFSELKRDGILLDSDRVRRTRSGRNAAVFVLPTYLRLSPLRTDGESHDR